MSDEQPQSEFDVAAHPQQQEQLPAGEKQGEQDDAHRQQEIEASDKRTPTDPHGEGPNRENVLRPDSEAGDPTIGAGEGFVMASPPEPDDPTTSSSLVGPEPGHESDSEAAQAIAAQDANRRRHGPVPHDGTPGNSQTLGHLTLDGIPVQPVNTDGRNRRSDDDALVGHFVDVIDGEHKGRFAAFERVLKHDPDTGYPAQALIRTRDEFNETLAVAYEHLRTHRGR